MNVSWYIEVCNTRYFGINTILSKYALKIPIYVSVLALILILFYY